MGFYRGPNIVRNGLVLCLDAASRRSYPGSGTVWSDLSGNGYNGTLTNGPTFNSANAGSFSFDGTNDEVAFSYNSTVAFLGRLPYTLEVFARPLSKVSYPGFINRESGATRDGYNLIYTEVSQAPGQVFVFTERFTSGVSTGTGLTVTTSTFFNNWHQVLCTYDGNDLAFYYDGIIQSTTPSTGSLTNSTFSLQIANRRGDFFRGNMSIARIYNRALSATEILQNYNATKSRFNL